MESYWSTVLDRRVSRRRAMVATGAFAAGAAFVAACGGGGEDSGSKDKSSLLAPREDTTAKARPGGIWTNTGNPLPANLDANANSSVAGFAYITAAYSTLTKYGRAIGALPGPDAITGDAAESWELSPDGTQITLKLRQNHKFDPRPPTNGRAMTSADVKFSWDRTIGISPLIGDVYRPKNPAGQIESLTAPDERTVVIKLAVPYGAITELLSYYFFHVMPREADGGFNPKTEARGSGPFTIQKYDPTGTGVIQLRRNPDWYVKDRPFLDGMDKFEISEYAQSLAQFESKAVMTFGVKQQDILRVKKDHPEMVLRLNSTPAAASPAQNSDFIFSQREDSMFKDIRLRRAASMLYDRDLYIETFFSTKEFTDAGIAVDTMWTSHLPVQCLNWNDPRNKDFGEAAKWFKYDPAEAKKLLAASGFSGKFPFAWRGLVGNANFNDTGLVVSNMLEQGGMPLERNPLNENDWRAWKTRGDENYSGMFQSTSHGFNDDSLLVSKYTPQGTDRVSNRPIPGVTDAVLKIQSELDLKKRNEMIKQMQRQLADLMLDMPQETQQRQFTVHWPWLKNWGVFFSNGFSNDSSSGRPYTEYWYDASLKT